MSSHVLTTLAVMIAAASAATVAGLICYRVGLEAGRLTARDQAEAEVRPEAYADGVTAGHADGLEEGRALGREQGREDGYAAGRSEWEPRGYRRGHDDGRRIGRAEAILQAQGALDRIATTPDPDAA